MGKVERISGEVPADIYADVEAAVSAGELESPAALVNRLVTQWATERRTDTPEYVAWVRAKIEEGRKDSRPPVPADEVFDRLEAKYTAMMAAADHRE